jgi:uncharacterized protein (DUF1810 family)
MSNEQLAHSLERFVDAQAHHYDQVRTELAAGEKRSHWIWYVFPQMRGLGASEMSRYYGIISRDEARAYLDHPLLGARLRECVALMLVHADTPLSAILPYPDDLKFVSSMTLFEAVADDPTPFRHALETFNGGKCDQATFKLLGLR